MMKIVPAAAAVLALVLCAGPARADGCMTYFSDGTSICVAIPEDQECSMPDAQHMRVSGKRIERRERVVRCLGRTGGLGHRNDGPRQKGPRGCECVVNTERGLKTFVLQGVPAGQCQAQCRKRFGDKAALRRMD